ncbi:hypothetical protein AUK22_11510 [bacterium CG2_30_54_10]|nr:MAG: hypothetical protein AUK22_11510 [bacterium CG2_30_54_10]
MPLLVVVICIISGLVPLPLLAQVSAPDSVVVPGTPPISFRDVANHVRLLEFVVGCRATSLQKDVFLNAIKKTPKSGMKDCREHLLQARELIQSMGSMGDRERETIRGLLFNDFSETATSDKADPASGLFLDLKRNCDQTVFGSGSAKVSRQCLDAFCEYVGFFMNPEKPVILSGAQRKMVSEQASRLFPSLSPEVQKDFAGFDRIWFFLRASMASGKSARDRFLTLLRNAGKASPDPKKSLSLPLMETLLLPSVWEEAAGAAKALGDKGTGWPSSLEIIVW